MASTDITPKTLGVYRARGQLYLAMVTEVNDDTQKFTVSYYMQNRSGQEKELPFLSNLFELNDWTKKKFEIIIPGTANNIPCDITKVVSCDEIHVKHTGGHFPGKDETVSLKILKLAADQAPMSTVVTPPRVVASTSSSTPATTTNNKRATDDNGDDVNKKQKQLPPPVLTLL